MIELEKRTDFLFKRRSYLTGFSSILSLFGDNKMFNTSQSGEEADLKAIQNDWNMVGEDFRKAIEKINKEVIEQA